MENSVKSSNSPVFGDDLHVNCYSISRQLFLNPCDNGEAAAPPEFMEALAASPAVIGAGRDAVQIVEPSAEGSGDWHARAPGSRKPGALLFSRTTADTS